MIYLCTVYLLEFFVVKLLVPICIATVTFLLFRKIDDWKSKKNYSLLGVAIMETLLEEVNGGIDMMKNALKPDYETTKLLPNQAWDGMGTIPDNVLLRIIKVSEKVTPTTFPVREIRTHCKNYFTHMNLNWENALRAEDKKNALTNLINEKGYLKAAEKVSKMLIQTKELLLANSKRIMAD